MSGKGSKPRPYSVSYEDFSNSFDRIFGKKENKMQVRVPEEGKKLGTCGCGRSPTGDCIGWHGLSEDAYQQALEKYQTNQEDTDGKAV
jgi:hypothetical protein